MHQMSHQHGVDSVGTAEHSLLLPRYISTACLNHSKTAFNYKTEMTGFHLLEPSAVVSVSGRFPERFCYGNGVTVCEGCCWLANRENRDETDPVFV
jgi:hypothetical protein